MSERINWNGTEWLSWESFVRMTDDNQANRERWKALDENASEVFRRFAKALTNKGFRRIAVQQFSYEGAIVAVEEWNGGILVRGIHSRQKGTMGKIMRAINGIADDASLLLFALVSPFKLNTQALPPEILVGNHTEAELERYAFYHAQYVDEQRLDGLTAEQIKDALVLKYGYSLLSVSDLNNLLPKHEKADNIVGDAFIRYPAPIPV